MLKLNISQLVVYGDFVFVNEVTLMLLSFYPERKGVKIYWSK